MPKVSPRMVSASCGSVLGVQTSPPSPRTVTARFDTASGLARQTSMACRRSHAGSCRERPSGWVGGPCQGITWVGRGPVCALSAPKLPAALSHLKTIPIRILEPRGITPGVLEDLGRIELHATRPQRLESHSHIFDLDRVDRGPRLAPGGCARPQNEVEVLPLDADGQESRSIGCRGVDPLLEAEDICVEVERLVLIAHQNRYVHFFLQHRRSSAPLFPVVMTTNGGSGMGHCDRRRRGRNLWRARA